MRMCKTLLGCVRRGPHPIKSHLVRPSVIQVRRLLKDPPKTRSSLSCRRCFWYNFRDGERCLGERGEGGGGNVNDSGTPWRPRVGSASCAQCPKRKVGVANRGRPRRAKDCAPSPPNATKPNSEVSRCTIWRGEAESAAPTPAASTWVTAACRRVRRQLRHTFASAGATPIVENRCSRLRAT